jgi:hypothetical protein
MIDMIALLEVSEHEGIGTRNPICHLETSYHAAMFFAVFLPGK